MAFQPVRMTDPKGKLDDVVATCAADYSNFLYRDGYVVSEDQSRLGGEDEVASGGEEPKAKRSSGSSTTGGEPVVTAN